MSEEQREIRRKAAGLNVTLKCEQTDAAKPCRLRDLSLNGAFVECAEGRFSEDGDIELDIRFEEEGKEQHHKVPAKVVRITEEGAAVQFRKVDIDTFGEILRLYVHKE